MKLISACLISFFLLAACAPRTPAVTPVILHVQYTAVTKPWLADLFQCAGQNGVDAQLVAADSMQVEQAQLSLRLGEPAQLTSPSYQIGTDPIEVIANPQNKVKQLTAKQARDLFTGRIENWKDLQGADAPVEVWVFAAGEDVEQLFERSVLAGSPVTSLAHLAVSPDEMAAAVARDDHAVGFLTKSWNAKGVSTLLTVANEPVLILTPAQPEGTSLQIIDCLQK